MLYPNFLSVNGYSKKLLKEYHEEYSNFLNEIEIKKTIGYILSMINSILEQNKEGSFLVAIKWLTTIDELSKEKCIEFSKQIGPVDAMSVLFGAVQKKSDHIASLIQSNMRFTVNEQSKIQYLDFLNKMSIRCIKELALVNAPKQSVTFSEQEQKEVGKENIVLDHKKFKFNEL